MRDPIDDLNESHQNDNLDRQRDEREQRMITVLFVEFRRFFPDHIIVAIKIYLDAK